MNFANFLHDITKSNPHSLSDALTCCAYSQIPFLLEKLERYLVEQGLMPTDCVAVECRNSVPSALLILLLLKRQQGFMLLPSLENKEPTETLKPIPSFCRYRLVIKPVAKLDAATILENPHLFLDIELLNPSSQIETQGKLFLRTSGSMGNAKIVVHHHENLLETAKRVIEKYRFVQDDRFAMPVPLFHLYGFGAEFLPAILLGASLDLQENSNLLKYLDHERRFNPTVAFLTPNLCEMILKGRKTARPYKTVVVSGQRISVALFLAFDELCGNALINQYGSSEMGVIAACDITDTSQTRAKTIGKPIQGVELRIEENGNLYCKHPFQFLGYVDNAGNGLDFAQTWHCTGDKATLNGDGDGEISVIGRAGNSLNRSGYLIELTDIERTLEKLTYLMQVIVVATNEEDIQGQKLKAFCVLNHSQIVDEKQILHDCKAMLPNYAVPDEIVILQKLPLLPSGKIDRQFLQKRL